MTTISELKTAQTAILNIFHATPVNMHRELDFTVEFLVKNPSMSREHIMEAVTTFVTDGVVSFVDRPYNGYPKIRLTDFGRLVVRKMFNTASDDSIATVLAAAYKL